MNHNTKYRTHVDNMTITDVSDWEDMWSLRAGSGGFGLAKKYGVKPEIGDEVTIHVYQGSCIRGMELNGVLVFYKTDMDIEREREEYRVAREIEKKETFERNKASMDAKYETLPQCFKDRIDRFRSESPDFRLEHEAYEMFCIEQGILIANACKTAENIRKFIDGERSLVPDLDDGHSGGTMAGSCRLAYWYLENYKP